MLKTMIATVAVGAALSTAPTYAKMVCHDVPGLGATPNSPPVINQVCEDKEAGQQQWIALYCSYHPADSNCAALGYRSTSADPIDQAVDRRLVDHFCAANPTLSRCISPFTFIPRGKTEPVAQPVAPSATREECSPDNITANCVILPKLGTHECPAGYSWDESMKACNDD
jgi:hypothetical protein